MAGGITIGGVSIPLPAPKKAGVLNAPTAQPVPTIGGMPLTSGTYLPNSLPGKGQLSSFEKGTTKTIGTLSPAETAGLKAGLPNKQDVAANATTHIKDMQQFLKNKGYNVTVDGIRGPQTSAAVAAFHNHITAQQFNSRYRGTNPANGQFKPTNRPVVPAGSGGSIAPSSGTTGGNGSNDNAPTPGIPNLSPDASSQMLAQAQANAQYDPAINDLQSQISQASNQNTANQNSLQGWYQQMQNLMAQQLQGEQTNADQGGQAYAQALGNAAQLFGGAQAGAVGNAGQNGADALSATNQSEQDYLKNMAPLLNAQAAQGTSDLTNAYNQQSSSLHSQLQGDQQAKGNAYVQDYQTALSNAVTQQQNQQALADAQQLFPYQLASAKSQATADASNAAAAPQLNAAKLQQVQASTSKYMADAKAAIAKGGVFTSGSKDRQTLIKNLGSAMTNSAGTALIANPVQAQQALYTQAVAYGLINSNGAELVPGASTALKAVLQNAYASTPAWRTSWQWNGTTFVKNKK